jgi:hypothetical protein
MDFSRALYGTGTLDCAAVFVVVVVTSQVPSIAGFRYTMDTERYVNSVVGVA